MDNASKYKIVEKIIQSDDEKLLQEIQALVGLSEADFWDEVPSEVQESISSAKEELDNEEGISHEEAMQQFTQQFPTS